MNSTSLFYITPEINELSCLFPLDEAQRTPVGYVHFVLVLQGDALVKIDSHTLRLRKGTFLFLLPQMLLRGMSSSEDFKYEYLRFGFDYLSDFPLLLKAEISDNAVNTPQRLLDADTFELANRYFDFIRECHARHTSIQADTTKGLLFSFIVEFGRLYGSCPISDAASRPDELTDRFFSLLHTYYREEHRAAFYADRLCVSDKHLMRTIKMRTGSTFHFWLSDFLIREAKLQLRSTNKTISQIAEELYFPNSSFFARFFRKHTGVSPLQFRKEGAAF